MKLGFKANEIEFFVELNADEVYSFAVGTIKLFNELPLNEMFGDEASSFIESILSVVNSEMEEKPDEDPEEPEEEPEEPAVKQEKTMIPCRTWNHGNDEAKYKFIKNWLRRRKIPFKEDAGYTRMYITYELTTAQLERLQLGFKETFGEDADTEIVI